MKRAAPLIVGALVASLAMLASANGLAGEVDEEVEVRFDGDEEVVVDEEEEVNFDEEEEGAPVARLVLPENVTHRWMLLLPGLCLLLLAWNARWKQNRKKRREMDWPGFEKRREALRWD